MGNEASLRSHYLIVSKTTFKYLFHVTRFEKPRSVRHARVARLCFLCLVMVLSEWRADAQGQGVMPIFGSSQAGMMGNSNESWLSQHGVNDISVPEGPIKTSDAPDTITITSGPSHPIGDPIILGTPQQGSSQPILAALGVPGSLLIPANIQIKANVQKSDDVKLSPATETLTSLSMRITSKDLLRLIASAGGTNFPSGSRLVFKASLGSYSPLVLNKAGNVIMDPTATGLFASPVYGTPVRRGETNSVTGRSGMSGNFSYRTSFDDHQGNSISFNGLVQERYSSVPLHNGNQKVTDSIAFTGFGEGSIAGKAANFSERITGKGIARSF
jgi:hypothetical protein